MSDQTYNYEADRAALARQWDDERRALRAELAKLRPVVELVANYEAKEGLSPEALTNLRYVARRALGLTGA